MGSPRQFQVGHASSAGGGTKGLVPGRVALYGATVYGPFGWFLTPTAAAGGNPLMKVATRMSEPTATRVQCRVCSASVGVNSVNGGRLGCAGRSAPEPHQKFCLSRRPIVSSKIKGLRRVGIVGLSTVVAASMMTLSAAGSFATAGAYVAASAPNVIQGTTSQAAGNVSLDFANSFVIGTAQTFQIKRGGAANDCTTPAGLAAAISFSAAPTAPVTGPFLADGTTAGSGSDTAPTLVVGAITGSSAACTANNVFDTVTVSSNVVSTGVATDTFRVTLNTVAYDVGATAVTGPVALVTSGGLFAGPASVNDANVVVTSHFNVDARYHGAVGVVRPTRWARQVSSRRRQAACSRAAPLRRLR